MFDELTPDRLTAVERLWHAMFGKRVPPDPRLTPQRRQRARQMLRAIDARASGAIYRTVAEHLFPQHKIDAASWVGDPIREITIRLARDGMKLVRGGYRTLLRPHAGIADTRSRVDFSILLRHRPGRRLRATVLATRRLFAAATRETTEVRSWPKKPPIYRHDT